MQTIFTSYALSLMLTSHPSIEELRWSQQDVTDFAVFEVALSKP